MDDPQLKLFISHPWDEHRAHTKKLVALLKQSGLKYSDTSLRSLSPIQSQNKNYLRSKIRDRLRDSNALLFVAGPWVSESEWMQFELREALKLGKPVIAVRRYGVEEQTYEETEIGVETVRWNTRSIISRVRDRTDTHTRASQARLQAMLDKRTVEPIIERPRQTFWSRFFGTRH